MGGTPMADGRGLNLLKHLLDKRNRYLLMIWLIYLLCCILFGSCKSTKEVEVRERTRIDTLYRTVSARDSIYVQDSILIREKGDTILSERWHLKYIDRWHTDTIYKSLTDTAYINVEKKTSISKLERAKYFFTDFGIVMVLVILSAIVIYWMRKRGSNG